MAKNNKNANQSHGRGGTLTCACMADVPGIARTETCRCTEEQYFPNKVPQKWTCPDCVKGKHKSY